MSKAKNLLLGLGLIASQGLSAQQSDTISRELQQKIHDNFVLYKNTVGFPYDTLYSEYDSIAENTYDPRNNVITTARGGKGYGHIVFNKKSPEKMISDQVITHEMTHARRDTIYAPVDYTLNDGSKIIGVNGLTFLVLTKDGKETTFGLIEEAIAEYIAWKLTGKTYPDLDPRYYALLCYMKKMDENKVISPKNMLITIDNDYYQHILDILGRGTEPQRGDKLFGFFTEIYNLGLNDQGNLDTNFVTVEQKADKFFNEHVKVTPK